MAWEYRSHEMATLGDIFVTEVFIDEGEETKKRIRHIEVNDDVSSESDAVKNDASTVWTAEVIAAWEAEKLTH